MRGERPAFAPVILLCLWIGFILAINGPVASPKYRLPIEPALMIFAGAGYDADSVARPLQQAKRLAKQQIYLCRMRLRGLDAAGSIRRIKGCKSADRSFQREIIHDSLAGLLRPRPPVGWRQFGDLPNRRGNCLRTARRNDKAGLANNELRVAHFGRNRNQSCTHAFGNYVGKAFGEGRRRDFTMSEAAEYRSTSRRKPRA